jgi:ankyrin repeat protein
MIEASQQLFAASKHGDAEAARVLLEHGAAVNALDDYGWAAIDDACWYGHVETAKVLLAHGADINKQNNGWTPLKYACEGRHIEIVRMLISAGCRPLVEISPHWLTSIKVLLCEYNAESTKTLT